MKSAVGLCFRNRGGVVARSARLGGSWKEMSVTGKTFGFQKTSDRKVSVINEGEDEKALMDCFQGIWNALQPIRPP